MSTTTTTTPRIYVACLAAYNNGRLHGEWIDADQDTEEIYEEVRTMLAASPEPGAEEWAIHDYEGFGSLRLSEWESFERVAAIAAGISEHGEAFAAWLSDDGGRDPLNAEEFQEAYLGEWPSLRGYAENYAEETGMFDAAEQTEWAYIVVDIDAMVRDMEIELSTVESDHGTVYVFNPSV
jgi:antirestriction protein